MSNDLRRNLRELEDELWEMDVDAICAEFSDDPDSYADYRLQEPAYEEETEDYEEEDYEEPAAVYVADRKALKAQRKEEKRAAKRRKRRSLTGLTILAFLELLGIIGVLLYWLRFFL